ncbi:hypothetical protein V6Z12_D07G089200 [Gossypium hirsutum]
MATEEVNKPPSLPSYPQLIMNAIEALNDKNGSNKTSISKYIESKYGDLPAGHTTLLSHHLNGVVLTPARPRGRPPKDPNAPITSSKPGTGKPRGRPRKMARPEGGITGNSTLISTGSGRPRGRPPKVKTSPLTEVSVGH